jgi:YD repeat-containing protein
MKLRMLARGTAYVVTFCVLSAFLPLSRANGSTSAGGLDGPASTASTAYTATGFQSARRMQLSPMGATDSTLTYYGPPYFQYGYSNFGPWSTVGAAINAWWIDYQGRWPSAFPGCSYTVELLNPNTINNNDQSIGEVAQMPLHGTCGGWGRVLATAYPYKPGKNNGKPCNCVGDPINFGTGNEYRDDQDLSLSWLSLHRYYNSHASVALSHIGAQWRHSFDRSLEYLHDSVNGTVTVYRQDGRQVAFTLSSGQWIADPDVADTLTPVSDASGNLSGWVFTDASTREQESYDVSGHLLVIADVNKQRVVLTYSDATTPAAVAPFAGLLLKVTDPLGRQLSFTYDNQGRVANITQPDGGVLAYTYGGNGTLVRVTYPDTTYRQYIYNESSLTSGANLPTALTGEVDENGTRLIDIGYDSQGRAILSRSAGAVDVTQVSYGSSANTVTYPSGVQVTYGLSTVNGFVRASTASGPCGPMCGQPYASSTFDANGYPYTGTDFNGHTTQTTYSAQGPSDLPGPGAR